MERDHLRRVLIADEVGLGKTIEAGLLIKQLTEQRPNIRTLYLAPARLVNNVAYEFRTKLDLDARCWVAGSFSDARLHDDKLVIASIHKAVVADNFRRVAESGPWDVLVVDECHHLSDWGWDDSKPNQAFKLVSQLAQSLPADGRLVLMSGTPHQGSETRFRNLLKLLSGNARNAEAAKGMVIYRTKDRVRDWNGKPLFPARDIKPTTVVRLGTAYESWYNAVGALYDTSGQTGAKARAAGWAKGQALQWAASSVQAGLGFLCRLGMRRLNLNLNNSSLSNALAALRPYRGGPPDEPIDSLFARVQKQIGAQMLQEDVLGDDEEVEDDIWRPDAEALGKLLDQGVDLLGSPAAAAKWAAMERLLDDAEGEKVVLFAQPVETVSVVARFLERRYGQKPAIIIGNQSEEERRTEVNNFQRDSGPQFLVSSRAGGEGLNMQRARRLVHLDVPWNPMELEQRVGRIHRFGSRRTVIVDTIVVAGTREVDMYRIAREKLHLIAAQLDPDQFETLFSRVMSLVPPKELEEALGAFNSTSGSARAVDTIGQLVSEGYKTWQSFDDAYRANAERIRQVTVGEAQWSDLGSFLIRFCGAVPGANSTITSFEFKDDEIVAVDGTLPTLVLNEHTYACGDTAGVPIAPLDGQPVNPLGLNLPEITDIIREAFLPQKLAGAGYFRLKSRTMLEAHGGKQFCVLFFLRQTVRQELGQASEEQLSLRAFGVIDGERPKALSSQDCAELIRELIDASRIREPSTVAPEQDLVRLEAELASELRQPTDEDIHAQIRHVVWPIAAIVLV